MTTTAALYSAVDDEITHYELDATSGRLERRRSIKVPAHVQYAWPHPSRRFLYVATSNRGPGLSADRNHISAYRIDASSGELTPHDEPRSLYARAVHICVDPSGTYLLSAHNLPKTGLTVNLINADGSIGEQVEQPVGLNYGIYPHQVLATPSGRAAILVDRGNDATNEEPEDPGALRVFGMQAGRLSTLGVTAPNWGYGFGPRHIDFHPTKPWVFASLERQNQLHVFEMNGDRLSVGATFIRETLADPKSARPRQHAGAIHVHPNGRYVYLANRADWTVDHCGKKAFGGGENSIAVFALDQKTGEPTLIQHACIPAFHVRTFEIDPSQSVLVTASIKPLPLRKGSEIVSVPAAISVFRIRADGTLAFERNYDVETYGGIQYWMGIVGPQSATA